MSAPRTKRQFAGASSDPSQRQITSFFSSSVSPSPVPSIQEPLQQPLLPANVQTNLLSVGMRVRKSVPEGYKTGSPYSGFKLWSDADTVSPLLTARKALAPTSAQRELLPFCGIHSIGGLSYQPTRDEDEDADYYSRNMFLLAEEDDDVPSLDDVPGLTSSQETVDSNPPSVAGSQAGRKRFFDDAGEDEPRQWTDHAAWTEGDVSPRSLTPVGWGNARPIAVPRKLAQRKAAAAAAAAVASGYEQENVTMQDFEEADFLVGEGMDLTGA